MNQKLTHIKDVAKLLGVTRQAVYKKLTVLGKKPTKVGGKSFIDADTLKEIKEGKKVSPQVAESVTSATKQVDTDNSEIVNILKQQLNSLQQDKVTSQLQVDNLQHQLSVKDRQIEDLSNSGREIRLLLANAQQHIGMIPAPLDEPRNPNYEPSTPAPKQPEMKPKKQKHKHKKKKKKQK
jgi:hypothetical protein